MSAHIVDVEELRTTRSEKLLAVLMAAFLLLGGVWLYQKIDDYIADAIALGQPRAVDRAVIERYERAIGREFTAQRAVRQTRSELEYRREAYRTALEAGKATPELERAYHAAEAAYRRANAELARPPHEAEAARSAADDARRRANANVESQIHKRALMSFFLRLALILVGLGAGFLLTARLRHRNSRYLPLAGATLAAATILAFVLTVDYLTDYFEPFDIGLLFLALIGVGATIASFWGLQRYLARRLPQRRVRRRECPFCGFPAGGEHCEGCGRTILAPCARCGAVRRVGSLHCAACGQA